MVLSRKYNADTPNKLKVVLKCSKQHASALLNKVSPLGKLTIKKLSKAWGISPDYFYKENLDAQLEKLQPAKDLQEISWELKTIIDEIRSDIKLLTIGVRSLESSKKSIRADLKSINDRLEKFANTGDKKKLHTG